MEKLIVHILPNWIDIPLKTLLAIIGISFGTFIITVLIEKIKLFVISHFILIISLTLSLVIACILAIAGIIPDNSNSYTITKTIDTITVTSHSDWIANATYNIIAHKDGIYYLENNQLKNGIIKLKDKDFEKITNQK